MNLLPQISLRFLNQQVRVGHSPSISLMVLGALIPVTQAMAGNQAPTGTPTTVSTSQNTSYTFQAADFGFSDPSDSPADAFSAAKITTLPAQGTLTLNGTPVVAGQLVVVADISSGKLAYAPVTGASGSPYSSFTFQVQDNGTGNTNTVTFLTNQSTLAGTLNGTGTATAALPTATYPDLTVTGQFISGSNSWSTYQPPVATVTSTLFNASVTYPTRYLDEPGRNTPRNTTWTFKNGAAEATAASLATATKTVTYVFGVAGLGGEGVIKTITSSVPLTVIGNGDAFGNGTYSYLDGQDTNISTNPDALGLTGTAISTNPVYPYSGQGYTFFSLPASASSISLTETGDDPGGIVFGAVETTLAATLDPTPKTLTINVAAAPIPPSSTPTPVPTLSGWGLSALTLAMTGIASWRRRSRKSSQPR